MNRGELRRRWQIEIDGQVGERRHIQLNGIAQSRRTRQQGDLPCTSKRQRPKAAGDNVLAPFSQSDTGSPDQDWLAATLVRALDPASAAANAAATDLANRLVREADRHEAAGRLRARAPRADPGSRQCGAGC